MLKNISKSSLSNDEIISYILTFIALFIPIREVVASFTISYVKIIPDVMIFVCLIFTFFRNNGKLKISSIDVVLCFFVLTAFISTVLINDVGFKSFIIECRSMFLYYILFFILKNLSINKDACFDFFLKALQIIIVILSILAIIEKLFDKMVLFPIDWRSSITSKNNFPRVYSMFNNPNTFAFFNFLSFIILSMNEKKINRKAFLSIVILIICNIWLSGSRSTMLIFMFYLFMIIIKYHKYILNLNNLKKYLIILFVSLLSIVLIESCHKYLKKIGFNDIFNQNVVDKNNVGSKPGDKKDESKSNSTITSSNTNMLSRIDKILNGEYFKNSKIDGRAYKVLKGLEVFEDHMLVGSGFGSFGDASSLMITPQKMYSNYKIESDFYADNEFVKDLTETGIVGFLFLLAAITLTLLKYKSNYIKFLSILCVLLFGLFTNAFEVQIVTFLLTVFLSMNIDGEKVYK